ncbi:MAG: AAA family ATPase [Verrucomicrobiaceae bacterium]|nr:AAA family ATPase [Verrucomicrobiaceae bacterium]
MLRIRGEGQWGRHRGKPLVGNLFVVDEASMTIDAPLMAHSSPHCRAERTLIVGDADQPSVGPGMVLNDLIASGGSSCVKLAEIFRQAATSRIITTARAINRGQVPELWPVKNSDFFPRSRHARRHPRHHRQVAHTRLPPIAMV